MKSLFVKDLIADQSVTAFFLVHEKEVRNTAAGKSYLRMELGDRSGTVEARMWDSFEALSKDIKPEEIDISDFLPHTPYNVEELYKQLMAFGEEIKNPWLKKLVLQIFSDPTVAKNFKRAPAAKVMHHAYIGGLLEHVVGLCGLAKQIAAHYSELDVDLLLMAALLHDVGKLEELCFERAVGYTAEGQLLGHIVMELETVTNAMNSIVGFPAKLKTVVQHILISHHGQYEFGSPKLPMIREALAFHYMDDLDSKMAAVRTAFQISTESEWSGFSSALQRKFL